MKILIDLLLFLHHSTAVPCQKKCRCMKAILCNKSDLPSLHGFVAIRIEPAILHALCGLLKTIGCQRKILKEYIKANGQMRLTVEKTNHKGSNKFRSIIIFLHHQTVTEALHVKIANFIILIAALKYHRCSRVSAMQLIVHQLLFIKKIAFILNDF